MATVMQAPLTGISGMLFVYCLVSVFWLSNLLRGVLSCDAVIAMISLLAWAAWAVNF